MDCIGTKRRAINRSTSLLIAQHWRNSILRVACIAAVARAPYWREHTDKARMGRFIPVTVAISRSMTNGTQYDSALNRAV